MDTDVERELLTGDGIDQGLEDGREARWVEAPEALGQGKEAPVAPGQLVKAAQVRTQGQAALEQGPGLVLGLVARLLACHRELDKDRRAAAPVHLAGCQLGRLTPDHGDPAVPGPVPGVYLVVRSSPERPHGEVEPEGLAGLECEAPGNRGP